MVLAAFPLVLLLLDVWLPDRDGLEDRETLAGEPLESDSEDLAQPRVRQGVPARCLSRPLG